MKLENMKLPYKPNRAQEEGLENIKKLREKGENKGVIALPPGSGKTYLALLDSIKFDADKILYLIHQREILKDAYSEFRKVYEDKVGKFYSKTRERNEHIFSTVQTMYKDETLSSFRNDEFDYIILDEYHHSACMMFQKVLDYFEPKFTLGLTATPQRSDMSREELLEICDGNKIIDWDVGKAIKHDILCPFTYYGLSDNVDYSDIEWQGYKYKESDLEEKLFISERDSEIINEYGNRTDDRKTIAFCLNINHAERMKEKFERAGIDSVTTHSGLAEKEKLKNIKKFENNDTQVVFVVDMFNEGVNFPEASCLLLLRPTFTERIFWQQIGRGLRKHRNKDRCIILDFIGNHEKAFLLPEWLGVGGEENLKPIYHYTPNSKMVFEGEVIDIIEKVRKRRRLDWDEVKKEELVEAFEKLRVKLGKQPLAKEFGDKTKYGQQIVRYKFGKWSNFLEYMDLKVPKEYRGLDRDELISAYKKVKKKLGRDKRVRLREFKKNSEHGVATVQRKFGSWRNFLIECEEKDLPPERKKVEEVTFEELKQDWYRVKDKLGRNPKLKELEKYGKYPRKRYRIDSSYNKFLDKLGEKRRTNATIENILEDLKEVSEKIDEIPTKKDIKKHGFYSCNVYNRYGGIKKLRREIGLEGKPPKKTKNSLLKAFMERWEELDKKPTYHDMKISNGAKFSGEAYKKEFGSWQNFLDWAEGKINLSE